MAGPKDVGIVSCEGSWWLVGGGKEEGEEMTRLRIVEGSSNDSWQGGGLDVVLHWPIGW